MSQLRKGLPSAKVPHGQNESLEAAGQPNCVFPKRITFLAGTLGQGGAERQLFYILQTLRQNQVQLRLLCLTQHEFWESRIQDLGVPVTWVGQSPSRLLRLRRIISELRKERPDVLQSQHFYTNLYVAAAARLLGIREIGAVRNNVISEIGDGGRLLGGWSLRAPRTLAANSRAALQTAVALGVPTARGYLLPNVVDTDRFKPGTKAESGCCRIVAIGRLVEQKRFDRFIRILAQVREKSSSPVQGILIGTGPLREQLEKQAAGLGFSPETLEFRGEVPDLAPVYREADILALTSDWEGTPNVVLEAMASGLAVVATKAGGVADIVQHGQTGFLAEPADEKFLVETLLQLVTQPGLRKQTGAQARAHVETHHSIKCLPHFLDGLYKMTLA